MFQKLLDEIPDLRKICLNAGKSFNVSVDELEQEGLIALWATSKKGKRPDNIYSFVSRSVRNACIDKTRTKYIGYHGFCDIYELGHMQAPDEHSIDWFIDLTDGIDESRKKILFERYILGLSEKEMMEIYDCAQGTIKSRVSRACDKIREHQNAVV